MARRRLSGLDAALLAAETPTMPLHTMAVLVLDPSTAPGDCSFATLRDFVADRLHLVPPLCRRLVEVPYGLGRPSWVEPADVDVDWHVRPGEVDPPGGARELAAFASDIAAVPLPRDRPLWQMHVVEGLADGRVAVVAKLHHALMDGMAGMEFMAALFSTEPAIEPVDAVAAEPGRVPSAPELLVGALPEVAAVPVRLARTAVATAVSAVRVGRHLAGRAEPVDAPRGAPRTPWSGVLTPRRAIAHTALSLADVREVARRAGVTVNDVVLAVMGGALRAYLDAHGVLPHTSLVAGVPVSTRGETGADAANAFSLMTVGAGTDVADPVDRLHLVHEQARTARATHDALGADSLAGWTEVFAPLAFSAIARGLIATHLLVRLPAFCNVVISNVPGPPIPLYFGGARLVALHPLGPVFEGVGLNVTVVSAQDVLGVGLVTCPDLVPDVWELGDAVPAAFAELAAAVGVRTETAPGRVRVPAGDRPGARKETA